MSNIEQLSEDIETFLGTTVSKNVFFESFNQTYHLYLIIWLNWISHVYQWRHKSSFETVIFRHFVLCCRKSFCASDLIETNSWPLSSRLWKEVCVFFDHWQRWNRQILSWCRFYTYLSSCYSKSDAAYDGSVFL